MFKKSPLFFCFAIITLFFTLVSSIGLIKNKDQFDTNSTLEKNISCCFLFKNYCEQTVRFTSFASLKVQNDNIIFGKSGYLFPIFNSFDTNLLKTNLYYLDEFSAFSSCPVSIIVVPSAFAPLSDLLPQGVPVVDQRYFIKKLGQYLSINANFINIFDLLSINQITNDVYYKTDKHWTSFGAWLAYAEFCSSKNFAPFDYKEEKPTLTKQFLGELFYLSSPVIASFDQIEYFDFINSRSLVEGAWQSGTISKNLLRSDTPYDGFLYGGNVETIITEQSAPTKQKILVVSDSFGNAFIPFLTENYGVIDILDIGKISEIESKLVQNNYDDILFLLSFENLVTLNLFSKLYYKF